MARTPFRMKSGNTTPFKQMGSSPVKRNIFSDRPGYKEKVAEKRAKFKTLGTEFGQGLKKAGKDIKSKVDKVATYISSDAVRARREARINKGTTAGVKAGKKGEVKSAPISPSEARAAMTAFSTKPPTPPKQQKTYVKADESKNTPSWGFISEVKSNDPYVKADESKNTPSPKIKVKSNEPGLLEQQITKTATAKAKTAKAKTERFIGPKQATTPKKVTTPKKATTSKKVKNKRKAGESQYQANIRARKENSARMKKIKKELAASLKDNKDNKKVNLERKKGGGPFAKKSPTKNYKKGYYGA